MTSKWVIGLISFIFGLPFTIPDFQFCPSPYEQNNKILRVDCSNNLNNLTMTNTTTFIDKFSENCTIVTQCSNGYSYKEGSQFETRCVNGSWKPKIPMCKRQCKPLEPMNVILHCYENNSREIPCNNTLLQGTKVLHQCKLNHRATTHINYHAITCLENGEWNLPVLSCIAECGIAHQKVQALISKGKEEKVGAAPWHVAIFDKKKNILICGGTIISEYVVVSAAHCFFDESKAKSSEESNYRIVVGKVTRDYNVKDTPFQKEFEIKKFYFHENGFYGIATNYATDIVLLATSTQIEFSELVLPACMDWFSTNYNLKDKSLGKVSGWGLNENGTLSQVLQTTDLEYVSTKKCLQTLSNNDKKFVGNDKFCARNASVSTVQKGDSGGGLLFYDARYSTYFLQGIVSINIHSISTEVPLALFTDIGKYMDWIKEISANVENEVRQSGKPITSANNCVLPEENNVDYIQCNSRNYILSDGYREIPHSCKVSTNCVYENIWFKNVSFSFKCVNGNWNPPLMNCPNITGTSITINNTKCPDMETYVWIRQTNGSIPKCALQAGYDYNNAPLYAGRAFHNGNILPAKISLRRIAYVAFGTLEHDKYEYEVLCTSRAAWQSDSNGHVPSNAIEMGITSSGEKLYMGRAPHKTSLTPGKIHPSEGALYIPYLGSEYKYTNYEVLVLI